MTKKQLRERKDYRKYIAIEDKGVLDTNKCDIELIGDDEVFVLVKDTQNYWISNYGRLTNNHRGYFYMHKTGNVHYTITTIDIDGTYYPVDTYCDKLVAEHFLENPIAETGCGRVWHIDGDKDNCYYRNLIWVSAKEYLNLSRGILRVDQLGRQQQYVPYITSKSNRAYYIWNGIYNRCYRRTKTIGRDCYDKATMCGQWLNDQNSFAEWYNINYYECDGETMAVDKDLLFPGNSEYNPDKCCILPQTLNSMLANCKKHRAPKWVVEARDLPLGVRYCLSMKKYYPEIKPYGHDETIQLSYWATPEEAFEEYKKFKQADILMMALKYKNKIPKNIYEALLKVEVKPY